MRSEPAVVTAAVAVWAGSAALNYAYVPWGASGASKVFVSAVAIYLISMSVMIAEFRRRDVENKGFTLTLIGTVGILVLAEGLFWLNIDEDNNKPMLLRLSVGVDAGFVATGLAVILALWPRIRERRSKRPFDFSARWTAKVVAGAVVLELALFAFRTIFRRTPGYYAMDCAMFAVAALSIAIIIAALGRYIPFSRRTVDRA